MTYIPHAPPPHVEQPQPARLDVRAPFLGRGNDDAAATRVAAAMNESKKFLGSVMALDHLNLAERGKTNLMDPKLQRTLRIKL